MGRTDVPVPLAGTSKDAMVIDRPKYILKLVLPRKVGSSSPPFARNNGNNVAPCTPRIPSTTLHTRGETLKTHFCDDNLVREARGDFLCNI